MDTKKVIMTSKFIRQTSKCNCITEKSRFLKQNSK